jgi:divalent metal cation (Fe/Co/Zn/Cd) transporter
MNKTNTAAPDKMQGIRQGLLLEYVTLLWNVVGVVIVIFAAIKASSVALAGFGLDSLIEILASAVVVWQLKGANERREAKALRIISVAFSLLAIYILLQAARTLTSSTHPHTSAIGIIWLSITFVTMLSLAYGKHKVGNKIQNPVLLTEGKVTLVDAYLAGAVLIGITLNALFGWWWADPLAGIVIVYYGIKESHHAWLEAKELAS